MCPRSARSSDTIGAGSSDFGIHALRSISAAIGHVDGQCVFSFAHPIEAAAEDDRDAPILIRQQKGKRNCYSLKRPWPNCREPNGGCLPLGLDYICPVGPDGVGGISDPRAAGYGTRIFEPWLQCTATTIWPPRKKVMSISDCSLPSGRSCSGLRNSGQVPKFVQDMWALQVVSIIRQPCTSGHSSIFRVRLCNMRWDSIQSQHQGAYQFILRCNSVFKRLDTLRVRSGMNRRYKAY